MAVQPSLMSIPFAKNGAKATIPVSTTEFGIASLSQGFPTETQLPLEDGGIPPRRIDFNGALNWLSMFAVFQQAGGTVPVSDDTGISAPVSCTAEFSASAAVPVHGFGRNRSVLVHHDRRYVQSSECIGTVLPVPVPLDGAACLPLQKNACSGGFPKTRPASERCGACLLCGGTSALCAVLAGTCTLLCRHSARQTAEMGTPSDTGGGVCRSRVYRCGADYAL